MQSIAPFAPPASADRSGEFVARTVESAPAVQGVVERSVVEFLESVRVAIPRVISAAIFLFLAAILVKAILAIAQGALARTRHGSSPVYRQFVVTVLSAFLWFGVALTVLSILGFDDIAASLGTATGFVALGVAYATSDMIADAVAGVYLLRDPDFSPGDRVEAAGVTGTVGAIELRKTRLDVGDDRVVVGNAAVEEGWTKLGGGPRPAEDRDE